MCCMHVESYYSKLKVKTVKIWMQCNALRCEKKIEMTVKGKKRPWELWIVSLHELLEQWLSGLIPGHVLLQSKYTTSFHLFSLACIWSNLVACPFAKGTNKLKCRGLRKCWEPRTLLLFLRWNWNLIMIIDDNTLLQVDMVVSNWRTTKIPKEPKLPWRGSDLGTPTAIKFDTQML